jgi:hypothetical protein
MKRVINVVRMQAVNWYTLVLLPVGTLAVAFVINLLIFGAAGASIEPDDRVTAGIASIYAVVGAAHLSTMTQVFSFAVGLSVTRRTFFAATAVVVAAQAALLGLVLTVLGLVERATSGWGIGMRFFGLPFVEQSNPLAQWAVYTAPMVGISALAVLIGVIVKRWGQGGLYLALLGAAVVLGLAVVVVTGREGWPAVGSFFLDRSALTLFVLFPLVLALALGGAGWLAIRRAVP